MISLPLMHCIGKTLAAELHAPQPMSYFRRSEMYGFAVVSAALMNEQKRGSSDVSGSV